MDLYEKSIDNLFMFKSGIKAYSVPDFQRPSSWDTNTAERFVLDLWESHEHKDKGIFLGNIISPIVMGLIYFVVVTPIALLLKVFGKDVLSLKKTKSSTYWKNKEKYNSSMKNQF